MDYQSVEVETIFVKLDVNGKTGETKFRFEASEDNLAAATQIILFIKGDFAVGVGYEDDNGDRHEEALGMMEYDRLTINKDSTTNITLKSSISKLKLPVDRIQELLERVLLLSLLKKA